MGEGDAGSGAGRNRVVRMWVGLLAVTAAVLAAILAYAAVIAVLFAGGRLLLLWVLAGVAVPGIALVLLRRSRRPG